MYNETPPFTRLKNIRNSKELRSGVRGAAFVTVVGAVCLGLTLLEGGANDPERYSINPAITSVTLENGANIRHDPTAADNAAIETLDASVVIDTPNGAYVTQEFHNGSWIGIDPANIPNVGSSDNDNIVWVNTQKADVSTAK